MWLRTASVVGCSGSGVLRCPTKLAHGRSFANVRQHVNPLAKYFQIPLELNSNWIGESYQNTKMPFIVDVGCGKGNWILKTAALSSHLNFVGLEIRKAILEVNNNLVLESTGRYGVTGNHHHNVHFLNCNANVDLKRVLNDIRAISRVDMICVHHPDPLYKMKQKKRAVLTSALVQDLADMVESGCKLYLQTDVLEVMMNMQHTIDTHPAKAFRAYTGHDTQDIQNNPSPHQVKTEREVSVENRGMLNYRMMYVRV